ncbi:hypothetical protein [Prevotella sp.]|jgi:hypothetical protein|uniref:hypothetical protein n=1 Tax=Prevotella sp. TaxID=59823 RepID=UPI003AB99A3F
MYNLDYLEEEWYNKLRNAGFSQGEAVLLARMKAKMDRDKTFIDWIRKDGFDGFCRWVEIHCTDIYYTVKGALQTAWNWLKGLF